MTTLDDIPILSEPPEGEAHYKRRGYSALQENAQAIYRKLVLKAYCNLHEFVTRGWADEFEAAMKERGES